MLTEAGARSLFRPRDHMDVVVHRASAATRHDDAAAAEADADAAEKNLWGDGVARARKTMVGWCELLNSVDP